jgi:sugar-specific transcriptional regulator TrmB
MPTTSYKIALLLPMLGGLAAAEALPKATPEAVGLSSARLERLAQAIKQDVEHGRMPGAVVAIARKGKLAYYESFGFVDPAAKTYWGQPLTDKELASQLTRFGATAQEAAMLVLLVRIRNSGAGGVTGSTLAELSKLNRVRTYQVLQRLADLGLVEVDFRRPKRYSAAIPQVLVRRLVAIHESRLTELTHMEQDVAQALIDASPLRTELETTVSESNVVLLHGLSNVQNLARRVMENQDLRIVVNEESEEHVLTTIKFLSRRPTSARVIFATVDEEQNPFEGNSVEVGGHPLKIRLFRGELPTMVITKKECLMLFYTSQRYKPRPLSRGTLRTVVSECILTEDEAHARQMGTIFEILWKASS